jgi:hypothetical protein
MPSYCDRPTEDAALNRIAQRGARHESSLASTRLHAARASERARAEEFFALQAERAVRIPDWLRPKK